MMNKNIRQLQELLTNLDEHLFIDKSNPEKNINTR